MTEEIHYGKFLDRLGAYLLDAIIIGIPAFALNYMNHTSFKSFYVYLPIALVGLLYKPFMESQYQATLGKMALNLKVTDVHFEKITFERSLLRSLIVMLPALVTIPTQYLAFNDPGLVEIGSFWGFTEAVSMTYPATGILNCFFSLIFLADLIVFLTDGSGKQRSLKDRMAQTLVLKVQ